MSKKLILFTYESAHINEIQIYIDDENKNRHIFKIFAIPDWLLERDIKNSFVFYLYLNDIDSLNNFEIVQNCNRGFARNGKYFSNKIKINKSIDEYFISYLKFNENNGYLYWKEPYGKPIESISTNLMLILAFICIKEKDNIFYYFSSFISSHSYLLNIEISENDLKTFLIFLNNLNENSSKLGLGDEESVVFICCCLGIINVENTKKINLKLKLIIEKFIKYLNRKNDQLELYGVLKDLFIQGIYIMINSCINSENEFLWIIALLTELNRINLFTLDFIDNLANQLVYNKDSFKLNQYRIKDKLKDLKKEEELTLKIINFFIALTPDIKAFFLFIEEFSEFDCFETALKLSWSKCSSRILDINAKNINENKLKEYYSSFQTSISKLNPIKNDFNLYFLEMFKNMDMKRSILNSFDINKSENIDSVIIILLKFAENMHFAEFFIFLDELNFYEINLNNEKIDIYSEVHNKLRKTLTEKVKLIQPPQDSSLGFLNILAKWLNSKYLFPFGVDWPEYFNESFLKKLSYFDHLDLILKNVIIKNIKENGDNETLKKIFIKLIFKVFNDYTNKDGFLKPVKNYLNAISQLEIKNQNDKRKIQYEFYKSFLENYYEKIKKDFNKFTNLLEYDKLFINGIFKEAYVNQFNELLDELKKENKYEMILIENMNKLFDDKSEIKKKILSQIFMSMENMDEPQKIIKNFLFKELSEENNWYKIIEYTKKIPRLNDIKYIKDFKAQTNNYYQDAFVNKKMKCKNVENLKDLIKNEKKREIFKNFIESCFPISNKTSNFENVSKELFDLSESVLNKQKIIQKTLYFLKLYLSEHEIFFSEFEELKKQIDTKPINEIIITENLSKLIKLNEIYQDYEDSICFGIIFIDLYENDKKNDTKYEEILDISLLFNEIDEDESNNNDIIKKLEKKLNETILIYLDKVQKLIFIDNLDIKFFISYFSNLDSDEKIDIELKTLTKKMVLEDEIQQQIRTAMKNYSNKENYKEFFDDLIICLSIFKVKSINNETLINNYLDLIKNDNFLVKNLNDLTEKLEKVFSIISHEDCLQLKKILNELSKASKLLDYLIDKEEKDIQNMIDSLDEHGDDHIRVENIIELHNVSKFIKAVKTDSDELEFLKSILKIIKEKGVQDNDKTFKNIGVNINTSNNLLENLKLIFENIQNREEASKIKIKELGENSTFKIEFVSNENFTIKTMFRQKRELTLYDLYDLRNRGLLIFNNKKTAKDYSNSNSNEQDLAEYRKIVITFIESVDLLVSIKNNLCAIIESGYPVNEEFKIKEISIVNTDNSQLKDFDELLKKNEKEWSLKLDENMNKFKHMCYFWGQEIFMLEHNLANVKQNSCYIQLIDQLQYFNANVRDLDRRLIKKYSVENNKKPTERIETISSYLESLFEDVKEEIKIKMPEYKQQNVEKILEGMNKYVLCVRCESNYYINALLVCFQDLVGYYPILNQILFCNKTTKSQELKSFLFRIQKEARLFTIVGIERLSFKMQSFFLNVFEKIYKSSRTLKLVIVTSNDKCDMFANISQLINQEDKCNKLNNYSNNLIYELSYVKNLVSNWRQNVTLVTSAYSGLGKSTQIKKMSLDRYGCECKLVKLKITDCESLDSIFRFLHEFKSTANEPFSLHIDILYSNNNEILNELLFKLVLLNMFKANGQTFSTSNFKHIYIELPNTPNNNLLESITMTKLIKEHCHISKFDINELLVNNNAYMRLYDDIEGNFNELERNFYLNLVCNYLQKLETKTIDNFEFNLKSNVKKKLDELKELKQTCLISPTEIDIDNFISVTYVENMAHLDKNQCVDLINVYFLSKLEESVKNRMSFIQFISFIKYLGSLLIKFSTNYFFSLNHLKYVVSDFNNHDRMKLVFKENRSNMVKALIDLSIRSITQTVNIAYEKQVKSVSNNHEDNEMDNYLKQVVNYEYCNYLMIAFSDRSDEFFLLYKDKSIIPQNLTQIFKSQDIESFKNMSVSEFMSFFNNDDDKSIFPDYSEQPHEFFFDKIKEMFESKKEFDYLLLNEGIDQASCKELIEKQNNKLSIIATKLNNYVLNADNFLKMILIYNKIKANLPVVIMGETGCGKTSLISYLALKLLGVKLLIFNIHSGITQDHFIKQINDYFLLANKHKTEEVWIFFDEFNTSDCMYIIAEMMTNRSLLGKPIPVNLKLLTACNPYRLKSVNINVGLVKERDVTRLTHIVYPVAESLIEHIWDYGSLNERDEYSYIKSIIEPLNLDYRVEQVSDLISRSHRFICSLEDVSSVSLRDIDRFRIFYEWFKVNIARRNKIKCKNNEVKNEDHELNCILLSVYICYYVRLSMKESREKYIKIIMRSLHLSDDFILKAFESEQKQYLKRMILPIGIAANQALRENVFVTFVCIMNKVPVFICGKPGCSKTLCIQLLMSNLRGQESSDEWFKTLPGLYTLTYQGSESSSSQSIEFIFGKAKSIASYYARNEEMNEKNGKKKATIPLILFDELGLAEISKTNPLKVLHSLLECDNADVAFVGISNWRLDASKMNRGVFLARSDLDEDDLKETAEVIYKSYSKKDENQYHKKQKIDYVRKIAVAYYKYKQELQQTNYSEFHGARDFYFLIKQISEKLIDFGDILNSETNIEKLNKLTSEAFDRNFKGIKEDLIDIKEIFCKYDRLHLFSNKNSMPILDLIKSNLKDNNSRYLMLIVNSDSSSYILDNYLKDHLTNRITLVGSKFKDDIEKEEYNFRTLSDVILYMEKGWSIIMQDMDQIYGSLYDLFNLNFTLTGGNKKNCRIALGSIQNPMCFVHDEFHCIILMHDYMLAKCETPFLNRFEKYHLNFDTILTETHSNIINKLKRWQKNLFELNDKTVNLNLPFSNIIANYSEESLASLVIYNYDKINKEEDRNVSLDETVLFINCKKDLIKLCSSLSVLISSESRSALSQNDQNEYSEFLNMFRQTFDYEYDSLNSYINKTKSMKSVVYTFDDINKKIELDGSTDGNFGEIKLGEFKSEKYLYAKLKELYKQSSQPIDLLLVRLEWRNDAQHLNFLKFLLDKIELESNEQMKICILIHLNYRIDVDEDNELNKYKISFLSGWEQLMMDSLEDKTSNILDMLDKSYDELVLDKKLFDMNKMTGDLILNTLNKFKYVNLSGECDDEFDLRVRNYKKKLINFFDSSSQEDQPKDRLYSKLFNTINRNIMNYVKEKVQEAVRGSEKDWRMKLLANENTIKSSHNIWHMLAHLVQPLIETKFAEIVYKIEKYFPFECAFLELNKNEENEKQNNLFLIIFNDMLDSKENPSQFKYSYQANLVNVYFNLRIPFVLKDYEIITNFENIDYLINELNEQELATNKIDNQKKEHLIELIKSQLFLSRYIQSQSKVNDFIDFYSEDLIKIYFNDILSYYKNDENKNLFCYLKKFIRCVLNYHDEFFSLENVYFYTLKWNEFIKAIYNILYLFKRELNNQDKLDEIFARSVDSISQNSVNIKYVIINSLVNDLLICLLENIESIDLACFHTLLIELFNVKAKFRVTIDVYTSCMFFRDLANLIKKIYGSSHKQKLASDIVRLVKSKVLDNEFLKDNQCINELLEIVKREVNLDEHEQHVSIFEISVFSLACDLNSNQETINILIDRFWNNEYSYNMIGIYFYKMLNSLPKNLLNISLDFLKYQNDDDDDDDKRPLEYLNYLEVLDQKFSDTKIGLDSEFAIIFCENLKKFVDTPALIDEIKNENNTDKVIALFNVIRNYENGFMCELISKIKQKNIAYLSALAYLKIIISYYCKLLDNRNSGDINGEIDNELNFFEDLLNNILTEDCKMSKSLRILILRIIYKLAGSSQAKLKTFIERNVYSDWKNKINFSIPKYLLDICLKNKKCVNESNINSNLVIHLLQSETLNNNDLVKKKLLSLNDGDERLSILLALINIICFSNMNNQFVSQTLMTNMISFINQNKHDIYNDEFLICLIRNFENDDYLNVRNEHDLDHLKLISIILHCVSITCSFKYPFYALLFENDRTKIKNHNRTNKLYWLGANDNEEYRILNILKDMKFKSYTQEEINMGLYMKEPGFALYKCSDECPYYYTVSNCTHVISMNETKCKRGHLLGGVEYHVLHPRPGHRKIENASEFIQEQLEKLKCEPLKGYTVVDFNELDLYYTVRSINPITYRLLNLFIHCNLYMLLSLKIYSKEELKQLLNLPNDVDVMNYLKFRLERDYDAIKKMIACNDPYIFVHAILYEMPSFLSKIRYDPIRWETRNNFEEEFEKEIVLPNLSSIEQTVNKYKSLLNSEDNIDEISLLLNESISKEFDQLVVPNYPLIKQMRICKCENDVQNFETEFNKMNLNNEYPLIDLYLKSSISLEKLSALQILIKYVNYLLNNYDHKITRNDARELKLYDCIKNNQDLEKNFDDLLEFWNTNFKNLILYEGCKEIEGVELKRNSPLCLLLVDKKLEPGSGIQTKLILQYLAKCQNEFLETALSFTDKLENLKKFDYKPLRINHAKMSSIIRVRDFKFLGYLRAFSTVDPRYGYGLEMNYNYEKLEFSIMNNLIIGKRLLNATNEDIRTIQYAGELLFNNTNIISDIRKKIPQESLNEMLRKMIATFISQIDIKDVFSSLETFLCYLSTTKGDFANKTLKDLAIFLDYKNISKKITDAQSPLAEVLIKNIIEVYEIFELNMFDLKKNDLIFEKYKHDLDEKLQKDFFEFLKKCNGVQLPSKDDLCKALKRLSMRYLMTDLDERQEIKIYLVNGFDLWNENNYNIKLDNLETQFPINIELRHTLSLIKNILDKDSVPIRENKLIDTKKHIETKQKQNAPSYNLTNDHFNY